MVIERVVDNGVIKIVKGDITACNVDAIVNAANNKLWMGGGVAGAIKRKGGKIIEEEAVKQGPIPIGGAVATTAGKLNAKCVIHAAAMGMDFKTDAKKVRDATVNALRKAEECTCKSIAFPAIGTGVGRFPVDKCAEIMISAALEHLSKNNKHVEEILFILYDDNTYNAFKNVLKEFL